jgi:hypothetical protein
MSNRKLEIGWLSAVLVEMADLRTPAYSMVPGNEVIIVQGYPLRTMHSTPEDLESACRTAVQGSGAKNVQVATFATPPVDLAVNHTAIKSFGVRVKLADSPLTFKYGIYHITLGEVGTALLAIQVRASRLPVDVIMLGVSNVGGQGSVISITSPRVTVTVLESTVTAASHLISESLNERDLGRLQNMQ